MKTPLHECAATGCPRRVPTYLLMCIDHWRMVPAPLQRAVNTAWMERRLSRDEYLAVRKHTEAIEQAVAAVATKQTNKNARRAAIEGDLFAGGAATGQTQQNQDGNEQERRGRQE